ncbi:MAG: flagellar biosynthesis protein FlhF [Rugosibacter sp.]|nr:flagellar biosynthesis protein FlhF [Rugosibacter sp.]
MTVNRFVAATARDCLRQVKVALGPDAVVISNRAVDGGVEIVAMSPESLNAISRQVQPKEKQNNPLPPPVAVKPSLQSEPVIQPRAEEHDYTVTLSSLRSEVRRDLSHESPSVRAWFPDSIPSQRQGSAHEVSAPLAAANATPIEVQPLSPPSPVASTPTMAVADQSQTTQLMDEMRAIKRLLEHQLAGFAWGEVARENPTRALLLSEMLTAGFSGSLARRLVNDMPTDLTQDDSRKWLSAAVNRRLRTLASDTDFIDRGGVYALVGPTGVGKTTTIAKLAARCVVRHGAGRLALVTTDSYRIGAHEQLRIYGRILGVPVFVVRDGAELQRTLASLREKHMVLIDTAGMSQRDGMVAEQAAMLIRSADVNRLLLLNAGSRGDTLDDVVRAYGGDDLAGCILTKVDEATALAPSIDCIVRHGLVMSYVTNGQRVPEDLHLPNRKYLLHRAFKVGAGETAHTLRKEEVALGLMPNDTHASVA